MATTTITTTQPTRPRKRGAAAGPQLPSLGASWWTQRDLGFGTSARGPFVQSGNQAYAMPSVPSWWGGGDDPASFYSWYREASSTPQGKALLPSIIATMQSTAEANAAREAGNRTGIATLGGARARYETELSRLRGDPDLEAIQATLGARATGADPLIGRSEEEQYNQELSQSVSRAINAQSRSAAARGVAGGGINLQREADILTRGTTAGVGLRADIEGRNRAAQDAALDSMSRIRFQRMAQEQAAVDELARIDAAIAAIEAGGDYAPNDFLAFDEAIFGRQQYQDELRRANEERELMREEVEGFDPYEFGTLALSGIGAGPWGMLPAGLYAADTLTDWW